MIKLFHYSSYVMDKWLELTHPTVKYVRYAEDAILHCWSKVQADYVLRNLRGRMLNCGLELHPEKTKVVYCKDYRRQGTYENVKFDFLGYSFHPRSTVPCGKGQLLCNQHKFKEAHRSENEGT